MESILRRRSECSVADKRLTESPPSISVTSVLSLGGTEFAENVRSVEPLACVNLTAKVRHVPG